MIVCCEGAAAGAQTHQHAHSHQLINTSTCNLIKDAFDGEGVEEEAEDVVSQVLQELALDTGSKVRWFGADQADGWVNRRMNIDRSGCHFPPYNPSTRQKPNSHLAQMVDAPRGRLPAKAEAASESEEDAAALKALEALLPPTSGT